MTPLEATQNIALALAEVPGMRVAIGLGRPVLPPAAIVGVPALNWEGFCEGGPTSGTWSVYLVSSLTEFTVDQLLTLAGPVVDALHKHTGGVVRNAVPGIYPSGQQGDLPCYLISIDMGLS